MAEDCSGKYIIHDIQGKIIKKGEFVDLSNFELDMTGNQGVFFLEVTTKNGVRSLNKIMITQ